MEDDKGSASRILLLKSPKARDHDPYVEVLAAQGYAAECVGVLGFQFINLDKLGLSLTHHDNYTAILLTSQRAAEAVSLAVRDIPETAWKKLPAYVVGKATGKLAEELGFETIKGADSGNAENLGNIIISDFSTRDKTILFPRGNLRKETLPEIMCRNKIKFEDVTVYETAADGCLRENLNSYLRTGHPDLVVFFSPSGAQLTLKIWQEVGTQINSLKCVAIGPSTEESLQENGYSVVATAAHPTPESVLQAISDIKL